jgi:hypothetical protein
VRRGLGEELPGLQRKWQYAGWIKIIESVIIRATHPTSFTMLIKSNNIICI